MQFRPCIDIHNGKVKQIVGSSLRDENDKAAENFVAEQDAAWYAEMYKRDGLKGGHVIILNGAGSPYYEASRQQAFAALTAYPGGLMVGGGVNPENAGDYLKAGASHVIVTSYIFSGGRLSSDRLEAVKRAVGKEHLVLDLSCRKKDGAYYVVTDRWQTFTDEKVTLSFLNEMASCCDEFLIHGVDVEGKGQGMEEELVRLLAEHHKNPVTYAGGVRSEQDLRRLYELGEGKIDVTVGSTLDLFGGKLPYRLLTDLSWL